VPLCVLGRTSRHQIPFHINMLQVRLELFANPKDKVKDAVCIWESSLAAFEEGFKPWISVRSTDALPLPQSESLSSDISIRIDVFPCGVYRIYACLQPALRSYTIRSCGNRQLLCDKDRAYGSALRSQVHAS
jgi:hypothetical protein